MQVICCKDAHLAANFSSHVGEYSSGLANFKISARSIEGQHFGEGICRWRIMVGLCLFNLISYSCSDMLQKLKVRGR